MRVTHLLALVGFVGLTACASVDRDRPLRDFSNRDGRPQEFAIVPNKPLQEPNGFAELPTPTPGGANRADQTPEADAVAALGGNPARLSTSGATPAADRALIARASRFGRDGQIRATLAAEDKVFRRQKSIFNWQLFPDDQYNRAYRRQALEPYRWIDTYRRSGAGTPAAPPR